MLFRPEHKQMILDGTKTATRRVWKKPMVKVGGIYKAKLKMLEVKCKICGKIDIKKNLRNHLRKEHKINRKLDIERNIVGVYFAKIKIVSLYKQKLYNMTEGDAIKEGYDCLRDFEKIWIKINGEWNPNLVVDVIEFELIGGGKNSS